MRGSLLAFCALVATATFSSHVWAGLPSPDNASVDQQAQAILLGDTEVDGSTWSTHAPIPTPNGTSQTTTASDCFGNVYVIGGGTGAGPDVTLNLNLRYSPSDNTWTPMAPVPTPLRAFGAITAVDGLERFLIFGGFNGSAPINTLNIYDAMNNTWSTGAPIPPTGGGFGVGVCQVNGRIFLAGGSNSFTSAFEYHLDTNTYSTIAPMSGGGAYRTHCAGSDPTNTCHCVANGFDGRDHNIYHVDTNTWTVGILMPIGVTDPAVGAVGAHIYVGGGPVPGVPGYLQIFDAENNMWTSTTNPRLPSSVNNTSGTINFGTSPLSFWVEGGYDGNGSVPNNYSFSPAVDGSDVTN